MHSEIEAFTRIWPSSKPSAVLPMCRSHIGEFGRCKVLAGETIRGSGVSASAGELSRLPCLA